jgi:FKBP-type peptidyl-prolyl cis-trans isomerase
MANSRPQYGFFILAALFLVSTFGISGVVIYEAVRDGKKVSTTNTTSPSITPKIITPSVSSTTPSTTPTTTNGATMLQGTKLQNFEPVSSVPQLLRSDAVVGTGADVIPGATVVAHYTGAVAATGVIFQSSYDRPGQEPVEFSLNRVIPGWGEGVPGMKVGGTRRLVIPAAKAYGANPPAGSGIPANADLVFDIVLTAVK